MPELEMHQSPQQAAELFDTWAKAGKGESMAKGHWPMVSQIIDRMNLQPGLQCLDVGCGNGYAVRAIAQRVFPGGQAVGVDVSPGMIQQAQQHPDNPPQVRFEVRFCPLKAIIGTDCCLWKPCITCLIR
jgi:ubiquinone/menaquinone biosynthesis C-methylase UbiE